MKSNLPYIVLTAFLLADIGATFAYHRVRMRRIEDIKTEVIELGERTYQQGYKDGYAQGLAACLRTPSNIEYQRKLDAELTNRVIQFWPSTNYGPNEFVVPAPGILP